MKILVAIMLGLMLALPSCHAGGIHADKAYHIGASTAIGILMAQNKPFSKWQPWQRVLFNAAIIGGTKEWYDSRHPSSHTAEWGDIAADAAGALGAEGMVWLVHKTW